MWHNGNCKERAAMNTENLKRVCRLYLDECVCESTLLKIVKPMDGFSLEKREFIASKIMELADTMKSEEDLIAKVQEAIPGWLEEIKAWK